MYLDQSLGFSKESATDFLQPISAIPLFCATLYLSQLSDKRYFTTSVSKRELHPIPPPEEPWTHCEIDLVCYLLRHLKVFRHLLGVDCYLTKYVSARALKNMAAREVLNIVQDIYLT